MSELSHANREQLDAAIRRWEDGGVALLDALTPTVATMLAEAEARGAERERERWVASIDPLHAEFHAHACAMKKRGHEGNTRLHHMDGREGNTWAVAASRLSAALASVTASDRGEEKS